MARQRHIQSSPKGYANHYLVDACFLTNKYLNPTPITDPKEANRVKSCKEWWTEIRRQMRNGCAKVFIPDICIAEAFKTLSKKYYKDGCLSSPVAYKNAREKLIRDVHLSAKDARRVQRKIVYHDIQMNRDIIISVDRFFEKVYKKDLNVGIIDLLLLATGKYLMDFYGFGREELFIITIDGPLYKLARSLNDIPQVFNPVEEPAQRVFVS